MCVCVCVSVPEQPVCPGFSNTQNHCSDLGAGFCAREAAKLGRQRLAAILGRPSLVQETSRLSILLPSSVAAAAWRAITGGQSIGQTFADVVLHPALENRVLSLATSTKNTKQNNAPYRNVCFYGPPGTGKTLVARKLANHSGLDYAIMSGGDVAPLGGDGVTQIHAIFQWAKHSKRGLLLFIDEAEAFLGQRGSGMSEHQRNALNAMLFQTGSQSKNFVLVLATNRPADLDAAVIDRCDEMVEFPLPEVVERRKLARLYFDQLLRPQKPQKTPIALEGIQERHFDMIAEKTAGYSGRGLSKLMAAVQGYVYGKGEAKLSGAELEAVIAMKIEAFEKRSRLLELQESYLTPAFVRGVSDDDDPDGDGEPDIPRSDDPTAYRSV
eukprot:SAG22_NODE_596_length_8727_cov_107.360338_8_plen_383_part_00